MSNRAILDPVATVRMDGWGAKNASLAVQRIVDAEGTQCVSVDEDGQVFCTPEESDFSRALLRSHSGNVAGFYDKHLDLDELADCLAAQAAESQAV